MSDATPQWPPDDIESALTALILNALPEPQATELRARLDQDAELRAMYRRLAQTLEIVQEAAKTPLPTEAASAEPLQLSTERRARLFAAFRSAKRKAARKPRLSIRSWLGSLSSDWTGALGWASALLLLSFAGLPGLFMRPRSSASSSLSFFASDSAPLSYTASTPPTDREEAPVVLAFSNLSVAPEGTPPLPPPPASTSRSLREFNRGINAGGELLQREMRYVHSPDANPDRPTLTAPNAMPPGKAAFGKPDAPVAAEPQKAVRKNIAADAIPEQLPKERLGELENRAGAGFAGVSREGKDPNSRDVAKPERQPAPVPTLQAFDDAKESKRQASAADPGNLTAGLRPASTPLMVVPTEPAPGAAPVLGSKLEESAPLPFYKAPRAFGLDAGNLSVNGPAEALRPEGLMKQEVASPRLARSLEDKADRKATTLTPAIPAIVQLENLDFAQDQRRSAGNRMDELASGRRQESGEATVEELSDLDKSVLDRNGGNSQFGTVLSQKSAGLGGGGKLFMRESTSLGRIVSRGGVADSIEGKDALNRFGDLSRGEGDGFDAGLGLRVTDGALASLGDAQGLAVPGVQGEGEDPRDHYYYSAGKGKAVDGRASAIATNHMVQLLAEKDKALAEPAASRPAKLPAPVPTPEVTAAENAFSTFSLNVTDVSFQLAGASLEGGAMPAASSIRTEEFINALNYHDPEPASGPLAFAFERARCSLAHNRDLARISIKTGAQGRQAGRPLQLVLLIDNSGSMERADRVSILRACLGVLATQVTAQDRISVITFACSARLWIDSLPGDQAAQIVTRLSELTPEGGTNLEEAMALGYQTARRHMLANGVNRVVLLTDGAANLGDVDPESLKRKVEDQRRQGIALDCFGIGWEGYNDDLLEALSRNGDGRYGFVNTPEAAATEFAGQLAGAL
ncbi:MAG: von Willebrand factor type A domain-containing protein, partial [Verrucomicrobia bacterium]|nr:von Willebrand factor type A domain-containing protein [Verrucomicrobiota bacterium]